MTPLKVQLYITGVMVYSFFVIAVASLATASSIPYIAPFSGDVALSRSNQNIVHVRASYSDELVGLIDYLTYVYIASLGAETNVLTAILWKL